MNRVRVAPTVSDVMTIDWPAEYYMGRGSGLDDPLASMPLAFPRSETRPSPPLLFIGG